MYTICFYMKNCIQYLTMIITYVLCVGSFSQCQARFMSFRAPCNTVHSIVFAACFCNTCRLYCKYITTSLYNLSPLHDMELLQMCACVHGAIVQRVINFHAFTAHVAEITNLPPPHIKVHQCFRMFS
jgi:hypothetical protein